MFTDPLGICDNFKFRIGNVLYSTQVYVVRKASFQLLLGTEFIWKAGIGLFPRWGAIMLSLPEFQVIQGTCERITADKASFRLQIRRNWSVRRSIHLLLQSR